MDRDRETMDGTLLVRRALGNAADADWASRLAGAEVDVLELSQWDAQKSRLRRETASGRRVGIALERGQALRDGDVLAWDEEAGRAVLCRVRLCPVMRISLDGLDALPRREALSSALRLGHALGNQHWPAVVREGAVYVPVTTDVRVTEAVMETHAVEGAEIAFLTGEEVLGLLDDAEARRLFGGAGLPEHGHGGHGRHAHGQACP